MKKTIGIIGFGRFGALLANILQSEFNVIAYDKDPKKITAPARYAKLSEIGHCKTIFLTVPIRQFSATIEDLIPHLSPTTTLIDTCSVKVFPTKIMTEQLPHHIGIIASHPLFGPDSFKHESQPRWMLYAVRDNHQQYPYWHNLLQKLHFEIINITPEEHDRYASRSQGITHLLGRCLSTMNIKKTPIDTLGFERLQGIINQTCNDTNELFEDLQRYNPYTKETLVDFINTLEKMASHLNNNPL